MDWAKIVAAVTALGALFAVIRNGQAIVGGLASTLKWFRDLFRPAAAADGIPKRTVVLVQETQINSLWWHQGSWNDKPALQVVGDFLVTNIWSKEIKVPVAVLRYREGLVRKRWRGEVTVKDSQSHYHGRYALPPNAMTSMRIHFMVPNTPRDARKPLVADVIVIDQFNNEHVVKGLVFKNTDHMLA